MSRLASTFDRLRSAHQAGLVTYVTAGDPDLRRSAAILCALDRAGADVLEVGVPFSDPVADGPVIQRASERALAAGGSLAATLELVSVVRGRVNAPIVLFTYVNPVLRYGPERLVERAAAVGIDGVLVLDLPVEEASALRAMLARHGLDMIFLLSPTSTDRRIEESSRLGRGFLYAISRLGVTGERQTLATGAQALVRRIREKSALPVAVGFGISRPEHVREVGCWADAAVVGSGLVAVVAEGGEEAELAERVAGYVGWLKGRA